MFDVIILGGTIVDGTGSPGYRADIGINNDRITAISDLSKAIGSRVINATGKTITPGFIDTHVHSDSALLSNPKHPEGILQGITTEILGQDGLSYCPLSLENYKIYGRYLKGILGDPPANLDPSSVSSFRKAYDGTTAVNTAYLIAHGALRLETCGFEDIPMRDDRLKHARRLVEEGMEQGAVGLATGMSYHPQAWSDTTELVEICKPVANAGGVYVTHLRDVNTDRAFGNGGVPEALEIGRQSGVKVHFSHYRTAAGTEGLVKERFAEIDASNGEVDISGDLYPYPTGSTFPASNLPSYAHSGGPDSMIERLKDPQQKSDIIKHIESNTKRPLGQSVLSYLPKHPHLEGMVLGDIAEHLKMGLGESLCHLLVEEDLQIAFWGSPPDSARTWQQISRDSQDFLARPDFMIGSDSIHVGNFPHPRAYGTFPRFIGRLRRQFNILSLEQVIQRATENPAKRFGLTNRGVIQKNYFADLVIFDPEEIIDTATFDNAKQHPRGISHVLVNGQVSVDHARSTGILAGRPVP
ncbi:MAG: hypothetical protein CL896_02690 [Dehalococcoidia bacterium]|nr:hypothetical protein [Dehalococcoidia bacterium]|tara:strand:+ start:4101 stop:5678 length:1578 start_codon:yes stop_codon:yes gene_type:complete